MWVQMSEGPSLELINLILGIVGTGTGIIALVIHFFRLRSERPRLKVDIISCSHQFGTTKNGSTEKIYIDPNFKVRNVGDRGTNVSEMHVSFRIAGREYSGKDAVYFHVANGREFSERKWIEAHATVEVSPRFEIPYDGPIEDSIDCRFALHHTHDKLTISGTSSQR